MSNKMSDSNDDVIFIREEHHVKVDISKVDLTPLQDGDEEDNVTHISKTEMSPDSDTSSKYFFYINTIIRHFSLNNFGLLLKTYTYKSCIHVYFGHYNE